MFLLLICNLLMAAIAAAVTHGAAWAWVLIGVWGVMSLVEAVEWVMSR